MSPMTHLVKPGDLVAERFRIVRFIAEGGMGEVYEAEDTVLRERVALKFLNRRNIDNEHVARRFRREILLARKVTHPNICRLFDVFRHRLEDGGFGSRGEPTEITFVTMELLAGETLEEYLVSHGPMSEGEALPVVRQMAEGLAAAHAVGVIHRDFKANNVILVPTGQTSTPWRAVITDFGLARSAAATSTEPQGPAHSPLTGELKVVGTADYMAPEQLYGEEVTPASDLYALGVVIFEMLTGERPYQAANPMVLLARRVSEDPRKPSDIRPDIDPRWEELILRCLERDPEERPSGGWEVITFLTGEAIPFGPSASGAIPRPREIVELAARQRLAEADTLQVETGGRLGRRGLGLALGLVLILGLVLAAVFLARGPAAPVDQGWTATPERLTPDASLEVDPALSPDGRWLAYSSNRNGLFEIFLRDLSPAPGQAPENRHEQRLALGEGDFFQPTFSPDGRHLVYHDRRQGGIWRATLDGELDERLQLSNFGSCPAYSPDGRHLVFQSTSSPLLADTAAPALTDSTLWRLDLERHDLLQLTEPGQPPGGHATPTFSPDGRWIAFTTARYGSAEIWAIEWASRRLVPLVDGSLEGYDPVYGPDGQSLYFSSARRQVKGLWRLPLGRDGLPAGPAVEIRNLGLASIRQLTLSADGRRALYTTLETRSDLRAVGLDAAGAVSTAPQQLTRGGGRNNRPAFSPDGSWLAYDHWDVGSSIDLWLLDLTNDSTRQLTHWADDASQPQWSPAGDRLVFHRGPRDQRRVWETTFATTNDPASRPLTDLPDGVYWIALDPSGRRLAYHSSHQGGPALWIQPLDGAPRRLVGLEELAIGVLDASSPSPSAPDPGQSNLDSAFLGFPIWSPDGQWLAFQHKRSENDTQIRLASAADGTIESLPELPGHNWPYSFSPDGDKIAFAALRAGTWSLRWISRHSGEEHLLLTADQLGEYLRYPTWSPREDLLVYEHSRTDGNLFLLVPRED